MSTPTDNDAIPEWPLSLAVVVAAGVLLGLTGDIGSTALLVGVAAIQLVLAVGWVYGTQLVGRKGALLLAAMAAAASDASVSVWPHSRLGSLLGVFALAVPVMFVHQLSRGVARYRIVASLGAIAALVLAEAGLAALLQLRHEFSDQTSPSRVVVTIVCIACGGLLVSVLIDAVSAIPRLDPDIPRGLIGVLGAAGLGGAIGYLALQSPERADFSDGRGAIVGAVVGALAALLSIAASFTVHSVEPLSGAPVTITRWGRIMLTAVVPLAVLAPVAFLLCVAIRV